MPARPLYLRNAETPFAAAAALLGKRDQRNLPGRATILHRIDADTIAVRYQRTDVVTYHADGSTEVRAGSWQSITTKDRIKTYAPGLAVWQRKGAWFVAPAHPHGAPHLTLPFEDGILVWPDGVIQRPREDRLTAVARHAAPPPPPIPPLPRRQRRQHGPLAGQASLPLGGAS